MFSVINLHKKYLLNVYCSELRSIQTKEIMSRTTTTATMNGALSVRLYSQFSQQSHKAYTLIPYSLYNIQTQFRT